MNLKRIGLIAQKETRHILRDFRTLYLAFGVPLVMLVLFGYALTMDIREIPTVIVDQDKTPASRDLIAAFEHTGIFTVVLHAADGHAIEPAFHTSRAQVALVIPPAFERALLRGEKAQAQLIVDGTDANVASIALGYANAIAQSRTLALAVQALDNQGLSAGSRMRPPLAVKARNWFNADLKSQWYLVPGLVALIMAMMSAMLMALTVAREWERGTMEQLLVTPVRPVEILFGKLIPYYVIGLGQLSLIVGVGVTLFDVPVRGSLLTLYAMSSLFLVGALSQGLIISVITRQQQLAMQLAILSSLLPAIILSGFMSPIASMPQAIQAITYLIPARYFLVIVRGLFLKGTVLVNFWPQALALALFAAALLTIGVRKFKTRLD